MNLENKTIIIFIGASGSGKSKLGQELRKFNIPELVSYTSRKIRINEKEGINYYFKTKEEILSSEMIESSQYNGELYGLSCEEVYSKLKTYDIVYAITEINGVKKLREKFGDKVIIKVIFVKISPKTSQKRMEFRGDSYEEIECRLKNAEINKEYDNWMYADYIIDNNDSFEDAKRNLLNIIFYN